MADKYEEFKEWFNKTSYGFVKVKLDGDLIPFYADKPNHRVFHSDYVHVRTNEVGHFEDIFKEFEEYIVEKERKELVINTIVSAIIETGATINSSSDDWRENLYRNLKEKDLIK